MKENHKSCESCECKTDICCGKSWNQNSSAGAVYGLGLIGAAVFFIGKATSFWAGVVGLLKAIVWPAYLVYEAFNFLMK